jgi:hypothetical protein
MNKTLAFHYHKLSADPGLIMTPEECADWLLDGERPSHEFKQCEKYWRSAVAQASTVSVMGLRLCLFSGVFG